ncbi:RNA polymerase sigma factor [Marinicrinis sediminis]|uniref:RNA polymerase sigma factor n=1 Tax=Marinicrinis sediminis TaxID=1652465 RepID=A0ABW5R8U2_9BACL
MTDRELFNTYNKEVYRTCLYMLGNPMDAEDICQEVFIRAFRQDWQKIEYVRSWLLKIAVNQANSFLRKKQFSQTKQRMLEAFYQKETSSPVSKMIEDDETKTEFTQLLQKLPVKMRAAITLRYLNDLSLSEAAEVLNIPVGTVKSRLHKGLKLLYKEMKKEDGKHARCTREDRPSSSHHQQKEAKA